MSWKQKLSLVMGTAAATAVITTTGGFEGLSLTTYWDTIGKVPTACYGDTVGIKMGQVFTKDQCDNMLAKGLYERYLIIRQCAPIDALSAEEKVAYLDLAYNIGTTNFCRGTIPRKLKVGERVEACHYLINYSFARGVWIKGLFNRRTAEEKLCLKGAMNAQLLQPKQK